MVSSDKANASKEGEELAAAMSRLSVRVPATDTPFTLSRPILLVVGEEGIYHFHVHEELLVKHSKYFEAAMHNGWKEAEEGTIYLSDLHPTDFATFANFVYTGRVMTKSDDHDEATRSDGEWPRLARAWILGNRLISTSYEDAVLDAVVDKMGPPKYIIPLGFHQNIYKNTAGDCDDSWLTCSLARG
ncbi:hypothetical protein LTR49_012108 [Elasticomyces elasticus]|nr:hypothetical protein LTR49_012108 [Elasticomyces elasticus]